MTDRTLFGDVVKALQIADGPISVAGITRMTGRQMEFVEREIKRIRQCGPLKRWIQYLPASKEYALVDALQKCPHESLLYLIKDLYKYNTKDFDPNMDLKKAPDTQAPVAPPTATRAPRVAGVLPISVIRSKELKNSSAKLKGDMFDFSTIRF